MAKPVLTETDRYRKAKQEVRRYDELVVGLMARKKKLQGERHLAYREMRAALKEMRALAKSQTKE